MPITEETINVGSILKDPPRIEGYPLHIQKRPESYSTLNNKIAFDFISWDTYHKIQMKTEVCYQTGPQKFMAEQN